MKASFKTYGQTKFDDDSFLTLIGELAFLFSALAKITWGTAQDHLGFFTVYSSILGIQMIVCFTIVLVAANKALYAVWLALTFICEGSHYVIFPALASYIYGAE